MKTHLYTLCWNEADMLEFFFRNYDPWVDMYIVYDDGSTDGSIEILKSHPRVELRIRHRKFPDSHHISHADWLNEAWKESRGSADWVVVVDIDEHLFVPDNPIKELLERYMSQGITYVPALGYQILCENFPKADEHLVKSRTRGALEPLNCKMSIFNPDAIKETKFSGGRHFANSEGRLKLPKQDEILLFHYKYMGFERTFKRQCSQYNHVGAYDNAMGGLSHHYAWSREKFRDHWDDYLKRSEDIFLPEFSPENYPYRHRWWRQPGFFFLSKWMTRFKKFVSNPGYMIRRLVLSMISKDDRQNRHSFGPFLEELNRSPIKNEIYQLIIKGGDDGKGGDTVVASNGNDERGVLVQCQHAIDVEKLQGLEGIKNIIASKKENEKKYQKEFDAFVITNSNGFEKGSVKFAKQNDVQLVSRNDLIEFIRQVKVSCK